MDADQVNETRTPVPPGPPRNPDVQVQPDARQQLAADQTLLAWIRTAIALAALGFVVAKFNLFLREVQHVSASTSETARAIGLALVAAAMLTLLIGFFQHRQVTTILAEHGDALPISKWPAVAGSAVALLAIVALSVYLATGVH
jgi:inner membrane protein YidH